MELIPKLIDSAQSVDGVQLVPAYDPVLVTLSVTLAALTAYVLLRLVGHLRTTADKNRQHLLIVLAGAMLGGGIWSMHFTGMLAAEWPVEVTYDPLLTLLSLLIPIAISTLGIYWLRVPSISAFRLAASGLTAGSGIVAMHYSGMAAMHAPVAMFYRTSLFLVSIAIGIGATVSAFWFAKRFSDESLPEPRRLVAAGTAFLMAIAIAGMHYTGMAAMIVVDRPSMILEHHYSLDPHLMASMIVVTVLAIFVAALLALAIEPTAKGPVRLGILLIIMAAVAAGASGTAIAVLFDTAVRIERSELAQFARAQKELVAAVARFDARYSADDVVGGSRAATISQVREAHRRLSGFGESGEFYLARRRDGGHEYVVPLRFHAKEQHRSAAFRRHRDRPMQLALRGLTGTIIGIDYRGERVLAAYTPIDELELGLVIKLDMREIRQPFLVASAIAGTFTLLLIATGYFVGRRISSPVVHELEEKARLEYELEFARAVQQGLLPSEPPSIVGLQLAGSTLPARFVSGDFYDFIELGDRNVAMIVGDVAGKGVSAALLMARMLSDVRHAFARSKDPSMVLNIVNDQVVANSRQGLFVTICCVVINLNDGRFAVANAGHLPLVRRASHGAVTIIGHPSGPPLGVVPGAQYSSDHFDLDAGLSVIGYTDGVVEPRNLAGDEFGVERLQQLIARLDVSPGQMITEIHEELRIFAPNGTRHDDLTVLVMKTDEA